MQNQMLCLKRKGKVVTANTRGGFPRNSAPLWARGQDACLALRGTRDRSRPAAIFACKVIWVDLYNIHILKVSCR